MNDDLWEHFANLLPELNSIGQQPVMIAGGFGLILKQQWLSQTGKDEKIVVPLERWENPLIRSTKDVDIAIGLDLLCDRENQEIVAETLRRNGFVIDQYAANWRWNKTVSQTSEVIVEILAPTPGDNDAGLKVKGKRVKGASSHNPIHGRENKELVGYEHHPFSFRKENIEVTLPNPVTFLMMKVTAADEQWKEWLKASDSKEASSRELAFKHARDAYRILAMVTEKEFESAQEVASLIASSDAYVKAQGIVSESFLSPQSWNAEDIQRDWKTEDLETMQTVLSEFFSQ